MGTFIYLTLSDTGITLYSWLPGGRKQVNLTVICSICSLLLEFGESVLIYYFSTGKGPYKWFGINEKPIKNYSFWSAL